MNLDKLIKKASQKRVTQHSYLQFCALYDKNGRAMAADIRCIDQIFRNEAHIGFNKQKSSQNSPNNFGMYMAQNISKGNRLKQAYMQHCRLFANNPSPEAMDALLQTFYDTLLLLLSDQEQLSHNLSLIAASLKSTSSFKLNACCPIPGSHYSNLEFLAALKYLSPLCQVQQLEQAITSLLPDDYYRVALHRVSPDGKSIEAALKSVLIESNKVLSINILPISGDNKDTRRRLISRVSEQPPQPECSDKNLVFYTKSVQVVNEMVWVEYSLMRVIVTGEAPKSLFCLFIFPPEQTEPDSSPRGQQFLVQLLLSLLCRNPELDQNTHQQLVSFAIAILQPDVFPGFYDHLATSLASMKQILASKHLLPAHRYLLNNLMEIMDQKDDVKGKVTPPDAL